MIRVEHFFFLAFQDSITDPILLPDSQDKTAVNEAIVLLENAMRQQPHRALPYRLLIAAYGSRADWHSALIVSNQAVDHLNLTQPQRISEIVIPYLYWTGQKQACTEITTSDVDNIAWFIKDEDTLRMFAHTLLFQGQPVAAYGAYCIADHLFGSVDSPFSRTFRETILAIMSRKPDIQPHLQELEGADPTFATFAVSTTPIMIRASKLRWLTIIPNYNINFGDPLTRIDTEDGVFWWNGQAVAIIEVKHPGRFTIEASLRNSKPPPVYMALGIDGRRFRHVELTSGENSWQNVHFNTMLDRGFHTVNVWFLNNAIIDGQDRDGAIQWLKVQPIQ